MTICVTPLIPIILLLQLQVEEASIQVQAFLFDPYTNLLFYLSAIPSNNG